jgi:hypothetical protein
MPKTYKELHAEKAKIEKDEILATVRQTLQLLKICASHSNNFEEFTELLEDTIQKVESKIGE